MLGLLDGTADGVLGSETGSSADGQRLAPVRHQPRRFSTGRQLRDVRSVPAPAAARDGLTRERSRARRGTANPAAPPAFILSITASSRPRRPAGRMAGRPGQPGHSDSTLEGRRELAQVLGGRDRSVGRDHRRVGVEQPLRVGWTELPDHLRVHAAPAQLRPLRVGNHERDAGHGRSHPVGGGSCGPRPRSISLRSRERGLFQPASTSQAAELLSFSRFPDP